MLRGWIALSWVAASLAAGCSSADEGVDGEGSSEESVDGEGSTAEQELRGGERLSPSNVASLLRQAGFPSNMVNRMVCTAKWESSFYTKATNKNRNGSIDRGLFQINSIHLGVTRGCPRSSSAIFDPLTNTRCALAIFEMQGIDAWYGYKAHRSECDRYRVGQRSMFGSGMDDGVDLQNFPEPMSEADLYGEANASFGERPEGSLDLPESAAAASGPEPGLDAPPPDVQRDIRQP